MSVIISGDTGVSGVDGSAATPSFQGTDTNTGIFYPAADTIAFAEGGTEVMRIDSAGNVGIGTTSPTLPLDVVASSNSQAVKIRGRSSDNLSALVFDNNTGNASGNVSYIQGLASASGYLALATLNTERMRIDSSGNVGIGTTSPSQKLMIYDASSTVGAQISCGSVNNYVQASTSAGILGTGSAHPLVFQTGAGERMRIDSNGVITSGLGGMQVISGTAVSGSGTTIPFTGIPSWVKRVTVLIAGLSTNGASPYLVQLRVNGSFVITGYAGGTTANSTTGFNITGAIASGNILQAIVTICSINSTLYMMSVSGSFSESANFAKVGGCSVATSTVIDGIRITTVNGTDTFDAGTINILYE